MGFLAFSSSNRIAEPPTDEDLNKAITHVIELCSDNPVEYYFEDLEELQQIELGDRYQLYAIDLEKYKEGKTKKIKQLIAETDRWMYIVQANGVGKGYIIIGTDSDGYCLDQYSGTGDKYTKFMDITKREFSDKLKYSEPILIEDLLNHYFIVEDKSTNIEYIKKYRPSEIGADGEFFEDVTKTGLSKKMLDNELDTRYKKYKEWKDKQ